MTVNVLFLCTGNSARSIVAEALLDRLGEGRFRAFSAGSRPAGQVNPGAIDVLGEHGFDLTKFRSKSWDEFAQQDAPEMDIVFTVCDSAAAESCPAWIGHPLTVHWGIPDPAAAPVDEIKAAFASTYEILEARLSQLVEMRIETMTNPERKTALEAIAGH